MQSNVVSKTIVSFLVVFLSAFPALGASVCRHVFGEIAITRTPDVLVRFEQNRIQLSQILEQLPNLRKSSVEHALAATEFFDYHHLIPFMLENLFSGRRQSFDFKNLYDGPKDFIEGSPFRNYLEIRDHLLSDNKIPVSPELLKLIQKQSMKEGVEGLEDTDLGVFRSTKQLGKVSGQYGITGLEIKAINANPYLYFKADSSKSASLHPIWQNIKLWSNFPVVKSGENIFSGYIHFPSVLTAKDEVINILQKSHPELYLKILIARQENSAPSYRPPPHLEKQFISALIEERFQRFQVEREALGDIRIGVNERVYVDLVADFQRDLVSIHPFANGNGRSTRILMNYLLAREGLPPVRLADTAADLQLSPQEWRDVVYDGVVRSAHLYGDLVFRIRHGLTVEYAPDFLQPALPHEIDGAQFVAFLKALGDFHPRIKEEIQVEKSRAMGNILNIFNNFYRTRMQTSSLRFVDPDFVDLYGVIRSHKKSLWDGKISRWYDTTTLLWRGVSYRNKEFSRAELLDFFKQPSRQLISNLAQQGLQDGASFKQAALADFSRYNQDLLNGKVIDTVVAHQGAQSGYQDSYGLSTSKKESIAKDFAMGAEVLAPLGKHMHPSLQEKIKSRIVVASFKALKDVDVSLLPNADVSFRNKFTNEAEVLAIGGADPDSVVLIQRLNAQGEVIETLVRNFEKPDEILVVQGRFVPGPGADVLNSERILDRYILSYPDSPSRGHFEAPSSNKSFLRRFLFWR